MKKILALMLMLLTLMASVCSAEVQKSYDEKNSYAMIKTMKLAPATELDPESVICINMQKIYAFDSRSYDNAIGRYIPTTYITIGLMGNAAEKFENSMSYTVNKTRNILQLTNLSEKYNNKKQIVLASGRCVFKGNEVNDPFFKALKNAEAIAFKIGLKVKGNKALQYTIDGDLLKEMSAIANYDIYSDDNFLNIAQKANQRPTR